ncbi:MAG: isoprenylcysteine carboxyl methyltransferase family protein [Myxococcota bacterium]
MSSQALYLALLVLVGVERLAELVISRRNARWAFERGGREFGAEHFPWMAALHTAFLVAAGVEVLVLEPPFIPAIGWPALAGVFLAQGVRYWVIGTLGRLWNVRVIVVPGASAVTGGPYRWLRHPNYLAVVLEGLCLPLVHGAWITAAVFSIANAWLLSVRIRCEENALAELTDYTERFLQK